uniref:Uncharacterized protein n=1 Tax=Zea mays TaxID=4577 RepID=B6UG41_MAIZE|nr:hypothetical protein [Zea mays]
MPSEVGYGYTDITRPTRIILQRYSTANLLIAAILFSSPLDM